ncbi:aspartate carbamoyltransferase regulatory subunit, partial [Vibrio aestuarianus]|nr:aspartate carbamoyltransferase regulatory subunit [Vibrio aestuarianus]
KKLALELPEQINDVFSCPNTNCITHDEPVESSFKIFEKNNDIRLKCKYCEKVFSREIVTERE